MIKLLVADSHPIIRKGIELIFVASQNIRVVGGVSNGEAIFDFLRHHQADVILCEVDLPKLNGITALRRLSKEYPDINVLIFTAQPEEIYALNTIKAGASGYLSKMANIITLKEAITKVSQGETYLSPNLTEQLSYRRKINRRSGSYYKKLSTREIEVLKLLSVGKKNKEIAQELEINEKTVSTYKSRLMKKLDVNNIVDLVNRAKLMNV
ncbi:response regulator transcription factor [Mangrovimonas cancribranchiae]|uniref:Response regulator transcription factor n=1 Tax=Mangrovimonas cancribranchiae TaxID=3080055 RepID=A0AAU6NYC1_9FLAO